MQNKINILHVVPLNNKNLIPVFIKNQVEDLKKLKINPSIISFHTLKPLNKNEIKKIFTRYKYIVTLEDSSEINGLATIMKEFAFDFKFKGKIDNFSLRDLFLKNYGSHEDLLKDHGISKQAILKKIKKKFLIKLFFCNFFLTNSNRLKICNSCKNRLAWFSI